MEVSNEDDSGLSSLLTIESKLERWFTGKAGDNRTPTLLEKFRFVTVTFRKKDFPG